MIEYRERKKKPRCSTAHLVESGSGASTTFSAKEFILDFSVEMVNEKLLIRDELRLVERRKV